MAEADNHSTRNWLDLSRRARKQLREANVRAAEEATAARQRPGSNAPPITDAELAVYGAQLHRDLDAALAEAQILLPDAKPLVRQILVLQRCYLDGANALDVARRLVAFMVRDAEASYPIIRESDALEPVRLLLNAVADATADNLGPFRALLPKLKNPGGRPPLTRAALLRAAAAAGVAGLTKGAAADGAVSQSKAATLVSEAFQAAGLTLTPETTLQHFKRLNRANHKHTGADAAAAKLYADMIVQVPADWPLPIRKGWLQRLAATAARNPGA